MKRETVVLADPRTVLLSHHQRRFVDGRLVGPDHRVLVPTSLLAGGAMLVLCDLVARFSFQWLGTEPQVGAVTALVGGPLFLVLLRRKAA